MIFFTIGKKLYIKAMVHSPLMQLSNFFISYLDQSMTRDARRAKLKRTWYFDCGCSGCEDLATEESKHSAKCTVLNCDGNVTVDVNITLFENILLEQFVKVLNWNWSPCSICGSQLTKESKFRYI